MPETIRTLTTGEFEHNLPFTKIGFLLTFTCLILSFATSGFRNYLFGLEIPTDVSTLFIYLALLTQIATGTIRFPIILLGIYAYIYFHTFVFNIFNIELDLSFKHLLGLILFSISIFSFVSAHRTKIVSIIQIYYKYVIGIACIGILQIVAYVLFGVSFFPQYILSGIAALGGDPSFTPEIIGVLPRAIGLSTEPAHYSIQVLPGVYLALLVLSGKGSIVGLHSKTLAWIVIIGFILSFSIVGYFGLFLCILSIFSNNLKKKLFSKIIISILLVGAIFIVLQTNLMSKVSTLPKMLLGISDYQYTSSDLSGFALLSNMLVAREALGKSNYLGTGLNTHQITYDNTVYQLFHGFQVLMELNRADAGSLFIRLTSEFGLPGILAFIVFLYHYKIARDCHSSSIKTINSMCLVMLISYAARNGNYLSNFFILFSALYYFTFRLNLNCNALSCNSGGAKIYAK